MGELSSSTGGGKAYLDLLCPRREKYPLLLRRRRRKSTHRGKEREKAYYLRVTRKKKNTTCPGKNYFLGRRILSLRKHTSFLSGEEGPKPSHFPLLLRGGF